MISQSLISEFDMEMANVRKVLARVPDEKFSYKPHEKSMSMGQLASHLAELTGWAGDTLRTNSFDVGGYKAPEIKTNHELLAKFDQNVASTREQLAATSDEAFMATWTLKAGDEVFFSMPRVAVWRGMIMNHLIHHRGQMTVYLRLNDIPVPAIYGPSADEQQ